MKLFLQKKTESDQQRPDNIGIIRHKLKNKYAYYIQGDKRQLFLFLKRKAIKSDMVDTKRNQIKISY